MRYEEPIAEASFFAEIVGSSNLSDWESEIDPDGEN